MSLLLRSCSHTKEHVTCEGRHGAPLIFIIIIIIIEVIVDEHEAEGPLLTNMAETCILRVCVCYREEG